MNDRIKETFDKIYAEEELKEKTKKFLSQKTQEYKKDYKKRSIINYPALISTAACLLFLFLGGRWIYLTPTAEISIDINPSIELGVNRFDKVISVNSYNDDGQTLADSLNIKFINYAEAIRRIMENERITDLLSDDEIMTIAVVGSDEKRYAKMLSNIKSYTAGQRNTHCYFADSAEMAAAHEMGLSYGKYKAFLNLQALDPNITPEEIQGMTMREIRDLIASLSKDGEGGPQTENGSCPNSGGGHGNGYGRQRKRKRKNAVTPPAQTHEPNPNTNSKSNK